MKMITIEATRDAVRDLAPEVTLTPAVIAGARRAVERMLELS